MTQVELISEWHRAINYQGDCKSLTQDFYALISIMEKELLSGGSIPLAEIGKLKSVFKDSQPYKIKKQNGLHLEGTTPKKYKVVFRASMALKKDLEIK